MNQPALFVWGGVDPAPAHPNALLWEGAPRDGARSLTEYLEMHADEIRRRFLAWVHDLGEVEVAGRCLRERFAHGGGPGLWEMSLFVEQSLWKQPSLEVLVKVFALEHLIETERPASFEYAGADAGLHAVLRAIAAERRITYSRRRVRGPSRQRSFADRLPRGLQGVLALVYLSATRLRLRDPVAPASADGAVTICGPFFDPAGKPDVPPFRPQFWTKLPDLLVNNGRRLRWLHFHYAHARVPNVRAARAVLRTLDTDTESHSLVDDAATPASVLATTWRWLRSCGESLRVGFSLRRRFARAPRESFWPLIKDDWARTFRGYVAVENLFMGDWFERALRPGSVGGECIYLMENQAWERALAHAWRRHGRGRIAAVAHSTIRFWDLRYHCDPRRYAADAHARPRADAVITNGPAAAEQYLATAAHREEIVDCEALRYGHLPATPAIPPPLAPGEALRLLVLGDHMPGPTHALLSLVQQACALARGAIVVTVKPHPTCPVDKANYPALDLTLDARAIADIAPGFHLVFASNTTSGAVDAFSVGAHVVVHDDLRGLNVSPLRGVPGVGFVHNAADLRSRLDAGIVSPAADAREAHRFFTIDPALPRWRAFFGLHSR